MRKMIAGLLACAIPCCAQIYSRPSADTDSSSAIGCGGTNVASSAMPDVYTGKSGVLAPIGPSDTLSVTSATGSGGAYRFSTRIFSGFPAGVRSAVVLNTNLACANDTSTAYGHCFVQYSLDSGATWNALSGTTNSAQATWTASVGAMSNLATLLVSVCSEAKPYVPTLSATTETAEVYDVWVGPVAGGTNKAQTYLMGLLTRPRDPAR